MNPIRSFLPILFLSLTTQWAYAQAIIYEAENGLLSGGCVVSTTTAGYSGTGYVTNFTQAGDGVAVTVTVSTAGMYAVSIRYNSTFGPKINDLTVNGNDQGGINFPQTTTWQVIQAGVVYLNAGNNMVGLTDNWGYMDVDYFAILPAVVPALSFPKTLVTANPSPQALALWCWLGNNYGNHIVSGGTDTTWVQANVGKQEAIGGFDLEYYDTSSLANGATTATGSIDSAIAWAQAGGIVQLQWHWISPTDLLNTGAEPWWRGFYTEATNFDLSYAMANPSSPQYQGLIADLDMVGYQLQRLQKLGIPVLWRPLHEAQGGWFWWGAKGAAPCTALYNLMVDRFTNVWGLNNLIWVWVTDSDSSALPWYPGDSEVDVLGADVYPPAGDYTPSTTLFWDTVITFGGKKPVALTENGPIPDPVLLQQQSADWSWFMTWGTDVSDGVNNTLAHVQEVYNSAYVINQSQLPNFNSYVCNPTSTPTNTATNTPTNSPTSTPSNSPTNTTTNTPSFTPSNTLTGTPTSTATNTASSTSTNTPTITYTPTITCTFTATDTGTLPPTATLTNSATASATATPTNSMTCTSTPSWTATPTPTASSTATSSSTNTFTRTNSPTATTTLTPTLTATTTSTPTNTAAWTLSPTPPAATAFLPPYPNPVRGPSVEFDVELPSASQVSWAVYTVSFRKVASGVFAGSGSGLVKWQWDLRDKSGQTVSDGLYYVRLDTSGPPDSKHLFKVVVLR